MWDEIVRHLADFPTAVLTGVDDTGYPCSLRCRPEPDDSTQTLRFHLPEGTKIRIGPAGLELVGHRVGPLLDVAPRLHPGIHQ